MYLLVVTATVLKLLVYWKSGQADFLITKTGLEEDRARKGESPHINSLRSHMIGTAELCSFDARSTNNLAQQSFHHTSPGPFPPKEICESHPSTTTSSQSLQVGSTGPTGQWSPFSCSWRNGYYEGSTIRAPCLGCLPP